MTAEKYKPGDKVRVRNDLIVGNYPEKIGVVSNMLKWKNQILTIKEKSLDRYLVNENFWSWCDEMLEPVKEDFNELFKDYEEITENEWFGLNKNENLIRIINYENGCDTKNKRYFKKKINSKTPFIKDFGKFKIIIYQTGNVEFILRKKYLSFNGSENKYYAFIPNDKIIEVINFINEKRKEMGLR